MVSVSVIKYECVNSLGTFIDGHSSQEFRMNRSFYAWRGKQARFPKLWLEKFKKLDNV
jgi:hypothetical protein